jgi:hypothetical protein
VIIQYLGYEQNRRARTYLFRVVNTLQVERQFELSVTILLLEENKFKFQDLPDLCFSRLKGELTTETDEQAVPLHMTVSDVELKKYIEDHYPKKRSYHGPTSRQGT